MMDADKKFKVFRVLMRKTELGWEYPVPSNAQFIECELGSGQMWLTYMVEERGE